MLVLTGGGIAGLFFYDKNTSILVNNVPIVNFSDMEIVNSVLVQKYKETNCVFEDDSIEDKYVKYVADLTILQNKNKWDFLLDKIKNNSYEVDIQKSIDVDGLKKYLNEYNSSATKSQDAFIEKDKSSFIIVKENQGNEIDINTLLKDVQNGESIDLKKYYINPNIVEKDLKDKVEELNKYTTWICTYDNDFSINANIDAVIYKNDIISFDDSFLDDFIIELEDEYNSVGKYTDFETSSGDIIKIKNETWGRTIDSEKEKQFLIDSFHAGTPINNRTPIFLENKHDIGNTYIEVSIEDQYCWVYKDGELLMDTKIVTGTLKRHDTPTGLYYITECIDGKYLVGDDYKTWVDKWMRLTNSGIGLHDASWRDSFGGTIYRYDGSHGCINLPPSFAYELFEEAYVGMPVIIY